VSALGYMTTTEAVTGWRAWRVLWYQRLDGRWNYRLCAVGTLGLPKVWEPRRATVAVCSDFASTHEAPWPDHQCGIWALASREQAQRRLLGFMLTQQEGDELAGWAFGRVNLWGRVIEHEYGWRGQYAYPYELAVESEDEKVARVLRETYAVDVDWTGAELLAKAAVKRKKRNQKAAEEARCLRNEAERIAARASDIAKRLEKAKAAVPAKAPTPHSEKLVFNLPEGHPDESDVLIAFYTYAVESRHDKQSEWRARHRNCAESSALACSLCLQRGYDPNEERIDDDCVFRSALGKAERDGLVESGRRSLLTQNKLYALTAAGLDRLERLELPTAVRTVEFSGGSYHAKRIKVDPREQLAALKLPRALFDTEIAARKPKWLAARARARTEGRRALRAYLLRQRKPDEFGETHLYYEPDEILTALGTRSRKLGGAVPFSALMDEMAPGRYSRREASQVSYALVALAKQGRVERVGRKEWRRTE
jgi:DNA-binding PadR family transcriptional regulator